MADDRIFSVEIITPDRIFYKGEAEMIEFTTVNGEIGLQDRKERKKQQCIPALLRFCRTK